MSEKDRETSPEMDKGAETAQESSAESREEPAVEADSCESAAEARESDEGDSSMDETSPAEPDWKDMYARMLADFDNYRKRVSRDREELVKFAASETVKDMLVTADNLALALAQAKDPEDPFVKGVQLAYEASSRRLRITGPSLLSPLAKNLILTAMRLLRHCRRILWRTARFLQR